MTPLQRRLHYAKLSKLPCMACGAYPITIHHCHGGSLLERGFQRTGFRRPSNWLTIPLCRACHLGSEGIDGGFGVESWEAKHGPQAAMLDDLGRLLKLDLWELARADKPSKILPRA